MKRALILLTVLGLAVSPLMISQAQAAPVTHAGKHLGKHHKKHLKKRAAKRHARRQAKRHKTAA